MTAYLVNRLYGVLVLVWYGIWSFVWHPIALFLTGMLMILGLEANKPVNTSSSETAAFTESDDEGYFSASSEPDEDPPAMTADYTLILKRLEALESRIRALEEKAGTTIPPADTEAVIAAERPAKPILYVRTEDWCSPCKRFKADLAALKLKYESEGIEFPIDVVTNPAGIRWQGNLIPQFQYKAKDGSVLTPTGYTSGQLPKMIERMIQ
jgi:hypothetical protein